MRNLNEFRPGKKEGVIVSCRCRLIYPALFRPVDMKGNEDGPDDKLKYRLTLLVPKTADTKLLQDTVEAVINDQAQKDRGLARRPFIKVADQNSLGKFADEFPLMLRSTSKYKPQVVGPDPTTELSEDLVYSGRWGVASLNPYWYPSIDGGKPGVALGLNNVQYLEHDEVIGGSRVAAEDEFEAVEIDGSAGGAKPGNIFD